MKAASHAHRSSAKPGATRAAAPRVQAKARPGGAANHRRQGRDSFERQAEEIASRIMRGEKGLARHIHRTAAAGFQARGSAGQPLPSALRQQMETAFGADFSAVRIHTDTSAHAATQTHDAEAFASGRDIYFRAGRFAPHLPSGRELLAHELTHVLQQTGTSNSAGIWEARAVSGSGSIQLDPTPAPSTDTPEQRFEKLAALYRRIGGMADLSSTIDEVKLLLDGKLVYDQARPAYAAPFAQQVQDKKFQTKSGQARGFIADCLKTMQFYEEAFVLLDRDVKLEIEVAIFHPGFTKYLIDLTRPPAMEGEVTKTQASSLVIWLGEALRHSSFRKLWPVRITANYRRFLLRPHRPPPGPDPEIARLVKELDEKLKKDPESRGLMPQERVTMAWNVLQKMDEYRVADCTDIQTVGFANTNSPTEGARVVFAEFGKREQAIAASETETPVRRRLAEDLIILVTEIGPVVEAALGQATELERAFLGTAAERLFDAKKPLELPVAPIAHAALTPFHTILAAHAQKLFPENAASTLPTAAEYGVLLNDFRVALELPITSGKTSKPSALDQLDEAIRAEWMKGEEGRKRAQGLYVFAAMLDRILALAASYDQATDETTPDFADERAVHRVRLARAVARFAFWLGWSDVLSTCEKLLQPDSKEAVLYLAGEWTPSDQQAPERMLLDFPEMADKPVLGDVPLTVRNLSRWFRYDYNKRLRAVLLEKLAHEGNLDTGTDLGPESFNNLAETKEEVQKQMHSAQQEKDARAAKAVPKHLLLGMPYRFSVGEYEAVFPKDTKESTKSWGQLIFEHEKTQLAFALDQVDHPGYIFCNRPEQGVFGWIMPPLTELYDIIRNLGKAEEIAIRRLMQERSMTEDAARAYLDGITDDRQWVQEIGPEFITDDDIGDLTDRINENLKGRNDPIAAELPDLWRRLTIMRRRQLVLEHVPLVAPYIKDRRITGGAILETKEEMAKRLHGLDAPQRMLNAIYDFEREARPREEKDIQLQLLILMLAPQVDGIITGGAMEGTYAHQFYPLITQTIEAAEDGNQLKELQRGTNHFDPASAIVYIPSNLTTALDHLKAAKQKIDAALQEARKDTGYVTESVQEDKYTGLVIRPLEGSHTAIYPSPESKEEHEWVRGARVGKDGKVDWENTGVRYRLLSIERAFRFHPQVGSPGVGAGLPARYVDCEGGTETVYEPAKDGTGLPDHLLFIVSVRNQENQEESQIQVHANDLGLLESFYEIFLWRSFQIQMDNLAAMGESAADFMITAVSLIVPEVAAAEIIARTVETVASGELEELVKQVRDDPWELLTRVSTYLKGDFFKPEHVWSYLLLGGQHPFLGLRSMSPTATRQRRPNPRSRLGRIVRALTTMGRRFHDALTAVRARTRGPLRAAQSNLAERKLLAWVLRRSADWVEILPDLVNPELLEDLANFELPNNPEELIALIEGKGAEMSGDMRESTIRLLEAIRHFELPGELLDLNATTELLVQFICDRFGSRARAVRIAMELIPVPQENMGRFTGFMTLYQWVCALIADQWRGSEMDPNKYWREDLIPLVQDGFHAARDDLVEGLYRTANRFLTELKAAPLEPPTELPATEITAEPLDPEGAARPKAGATLRPHAWRIGQDAGTPLDPVQRRQFEKQFGAAFSHVRVHRGAAGRAATEPVGADAVTSGSQIYLNPSAPATGRSGEHLLAHELTHVVQQTGIVSPGQNPGPPTAGRAGLGLRVNTAHEASAERIADRVVQQKPLDQTDRDDLKEPAEGIQPSLGERTVNDIIKTLTEVTTSKDFVQEPVAGTTRGPVPGVEDAKTLWHSVINALTAAGFSSLPAFLKTPPEVIQRIQHRLTEARGGIESRIPDIARLAQDPKIGAKPQGTPKTDLNLRRFAQLLEGFMYGETGVATQITLHATTGTFDSVSIISLSLARMGDPHLWQLAVQRSYPNSSPAVQVAIENELRQRLFAMRDLPDTEASIWSATAFEFNALFKADFDRFRGRESRTKTLAQLPKRDAYKDTGSAGGDVLAVGTHGALTKETRRIGSYDRQSHHTTQFLLVEFFENRNTLKAFPTHHSYPGSDYSGGALPFGVMFASGPSTNVTRISAGGRTLKLSELNDTAGRGDGMPAVLLAARTHQRGDLHVLKESRWEPGDAAHGQDAGSTSQKATQGLAIQNVFNRNLPAALRPRDGSAEQKNKFSQAVNSDTAGAAREFYNAAVATYHWMYGRMIPALQRALATEEVAYYRGLAAINHTSDRTKGELDAAYNLTPSDTEHVFGVARANNNRIMSAAGWPTP